MRERLKPISLQGMTIEESLKMAMDAGPYPHEPKKKPAKKRAPTSRSSRGTSPRARRSGAST